MAAAVGPAWPVGCFNRPWTKWSYDETLDAIKTAGYTHTGLLTPTKDDPFTGSSATPEYLAALKQKIAARGLKVNMTALRVNTALELPAAIADTRQQIENGHTVGVEFALTFGEDKPDRYEKYFKVMADAAAFAAERGIKLVMKPHGGGSGASSEILSAIKTVGHHNFKIWYDAGNIIYYTGKDPVEELKPIVQPPPTPKPTAISSPACSPASERAAVNSRRPKARQKRPPRRGRTAQFGTRDPSAIACCAMAARR